METRTPIEPERFAQTQELHSLREQLSRAEKERDNAIHERESCHLLYDEILLLCGYQKGQGYPGIVEAVRQALSRAEEARRRAEEERDRETERREHTTQYYAERWEPLKEWARTDLPEDLKDQFFNIIANTKKAIGEQPPALTIQLNLMRHERNAATAALAKANAEIERLRNIIQNNPES